MIGTQTDKKTILFDKISKLQHSPVFEQVHAVNDKYSGSYRSSSCESNEVRHLFGTRTYPNTPSRGNVWQPACSHPLPSPSPILQLRLRLCSVKGELEWLKHKYSLIPYVTRGNGNVHEMNQGYRYVNGMSRSGYLSIIIQRSEIEYKGILFQFRTHIFEWKEPMTTAIQGMYLTPNFPILVNGEALFWGN